MQRFMLGWGVLLALLLPICGLSDDTVGGTKQRMPSGPCIYKEIPGRAAITWISVADATAYNCRDGVEVHFTFEPDDPDAVKGYRFPEQADQEKRLTVGAGMNPSRDWVMHKGLAVGSTHRCIRREIIQGTCSPVVFAFPDIDFSDWQAFCF